MTETVGADLEPGRAKRGCSYSLGGKEEGWEEHGFGEGAGGRGGRQETWVSVPELEQTPMRLCWISEWAGEFRGSLGWTRDWGRWN